MPSSMLAGGELIYIGGHSKTTAIVECRCSKNLNVRFATLAAKLWCQFPATVCLARPGLTFRSIVGKGVTSFERFRPKTDERAV